MNLTSDQLSAIESTFFSVILVTAFFLSLVPWKRLKKRFGQVIR